MRWLAVTVLLASLAFAQQPAQAPPARSPSSDNGPLLHVQRMKLPETFGSDARVQDNCIAVTRDGHFHLELRTQVLATNSTVVKVFEGELKPEEIEQIVTALDSPAIKGLKSSANSDEVSAQDISRESIIIDIDRPGEHQSQNIDIHTRKALEDTKKTLQPVLDWFASMEKRKMEPLKDAKPNHCMPAGTDLPPISQ